MTDWYVHGSYPAQSASGTSSPMRAELDAIAAAFAKLPSYTGNTSKAVVINGTGTALTVTTGTLALAGNLATTGAFNTTIVQGATISVSLPIVSGLTLATLTGTEALTNKTYNGNTWTAGTGTLAIAAGKSFLVSNSITIAGTDSTIMTFPSTSATIARTDAANTFTGHQTIEGVTSTGATGTGKLVFDTAPTLSSPVLVTPALGTPSSGNLSNCTGVIPTGAILDFGGTVAPTGYLGCDGSAVSRATYATLFTAIGTTWGVGDGSTTFNVPNLQRRTAVGSGGSGTATLANSVGSTGGEETHTLITAELASHTHTGPSHTHTGPSHAHGGTSDDQNQTHTHAMPTQNGVGGTGWGGTATGGNASSGDASVGHTHTFTTAAAGTGATGADGTGATGGAGSGTAHNVMQPSAVVLKIIKT